MNITKGRTALLVTLMATAVVACGQRPEAVRTGHSATASCADDGQVHAVATNYVGGNYTLNGGAPTNFTAGFSLTLDGTKAWTIVVDADDDFPTLTLNGGPCDHPTTTTCPDCVVNTVRINPSTTEAPPSTATTTTQRATSTTTRPSTSVAVTTSSSSTSTVPSSSSTTPRRTTPTTTRPTPPAPAPQPFDEGLPPTR